MAWYVKMDRGYCVGFCADDAEIEFNFMQIDDKNPDFCAENLKLCLTSPAACAIIKAYQGRKSILRIERRAASLSVNRQSRKERPKNGETRDPIHGQFTKRERGDTIVPRSF